MRALAVAILLTSGCASSSTTKSLGIGLITGGVGGALTYTAGTGYLLGQLPEGADTSDGEAAIGVAWAIGASMAVVGVITYLVAGDDEPRRAPQLQHQQVIPRRQLQPKPSAEPGFYVPADNCDDEGKCKRCPNWGTRYTCEKESSSGCRRIDRVERPDCRMPVPSEPASAPASQPVD